MQSGQWASALQNLWQAMASCSSTSLTQTFPYMRDYEKATSTASRATHQRRRRAVEKDAVHNLVLLVGVAFLSVRIWRSAALLLSSLPYLFANKMSAGAKPDLLVLTRRDGTVLEACSLVYAEFSGHVH